MVNKLKYLQVPNKRPKRDGIEFLRELWLEKYGIIVPDFVRPTKSLRLEEQLEFLEQNWSTIFSYIQEGVDFIEFITLRSSWEFEAPWANASMRINTSILALQEYYDYSWEDYELLLKRRIQQSLTQVYEESEEKILEILIQWFWVNTYTNREFYGEQNSTCILKVWFPDMGQSLLVYGNGLNIVDYTWDLPSYHFTPKGIFHLPHTSDYYSGEYMKTSGWKKSAIEQKTITTLDKKGDFQVSPCQEVPKPISQKTLDALLKVIQALEKEWKYHAELELTILPNGDIWLYQFREDHMAMYSIDNYLKRSHIGHVTNLSKEAVLMGYSKLAHGFCVGILPRNNIDGTFHWRYQVLELHDLGSEKLKDKETQRIKKEHQNEKILVVIWSNDSGSIERNLGNIFEGFIYVWGNVGSHAIGNTVNQIITWEKQRFVILTSDWEEIRKQIEKRQRLSLFYSSPSSVSIFIK